MEAPNEKQPNSDDLLRDYGAYDPKLDLESYVYPPLDLLPESLHGFMQDIREQGGTYTLPLLLDGSENPVLRELYHQPNVLLAGTIASGKTQFIYNQLLYWLYMRHPAELKFVICRSKPVDYNSVAKVERHFSAKLPDAESAIAEGRQVLNTINALTIECDVRLDLFRSAGVKNIQDYNTAFVHRKLNPEEGHRYIPDIVLILDDLSTFLDSETLTGLIRLTQQNLYTGIYVIAVTSQIMSRGISAQLRANFSVRLAMKLMSQGESRKILDKVGAEKLTNAGELLYEEGGKLKKGRQPFIDYQTIMDVAYHIGNQRGYPSAFLLPEYVDENADGDSWAFDINGRDPKFEEAARLVVMHQQGSTSLIQRKLKMGYNQAGRIIDQLEAAGVVGPFEGSKAREVLYPDEYSLEQFLDAIKDPSSSNSGTYKRAAETSATDPENTPDTDDRNENEQSPDKTPQGVPLPLADPPPVLADNSQESTNTPSEKNKPTLWVLLVILAIIIYFLWRGV